jgi:DNA primase
VEEQLLVAEINKIIATRLKKHQAKQMNRQAPEPVHFPTDGAQAPSPETSKPQAVGDEYQERDLVRVLMLFGDQVYQQEPEQQIAQFILHNIDDVIDNFDHKLYQRIVKEVQVKILRGEGLVSGYFQQHELPEVQKLAIDFLSTPYDYSENWEKKWSIGLNQKMPEENFVRDAEHTLKRFRLRKLKRLREQVTADLKQIESSGELGEDWMLHIKLKQRLDEMYRELAKELGTVVG